MYISKDKVASIRYVMKNDQNEVLEDTMKGEPVSYLHGSTAILSLLQSQLEGLKRGDKKIIYLPASLESITGEFSFEIIVDEVRMATDTEILLGYPVRIHVAKCEDTCDCYQ